MPLYSEEAYLVLQNFPAGVRLQAAPENLSLQLGGLRPAGYAVDGLSQMPLTALAALTETTAKAAG